MKGIFSDEDNENSIPQEIQNILEEENYDYDSDSEGEQLPSPCTVPEGYVSPVDFIDVADSLFDRVIKRYLNVVQKSFLKKIKEKYGLRLHYGSLRSKLDGDTSGKKDKNNASIKFEEILQDQTEQKSMSHSILKFHSFCSSSSFRKYTRKQLQLIFFAYNLTFQKDFNKDQLSSILCDCIQSNNLISNPAALTEEIWNEFNTTGKLPAAIVNGNNSNADTTNTANPGRRRPPFKPKAEDIAILQDDVSSGRANRRQAEIRATELCLKGYDVDFPTN